jgi:glyoxylase-like metal-dependent hydrolase (beta-lactamase superfamily II)
MTLIELPGFDIVGVLAPNPGPFTLTGSNAWVVGSDPPWLVDPGPAIDSHRDALLGELDRRGGLGGIALTHDHSDHAELVPTLRRRYPEAPLGAARGEADVLLADGSRFGPFEVVGTPGHAPDHLAFVAGTVAFTGDAVLGEGSVFIYPDPGALAGYLDALERLRRRELTLLLPGHGPPVNDPRAKLDQYIEHRLDRERRLLAALQAGKRTTDDLLDDVWADAPAALRPAAAVTLAAHLDKLDGEGRLPEGVQRPSGWRLPAEV